MKSAKSKKPNLEETIKQNWIDKRMGKRFGDKPPLKHGDELCTELFILPKLRQN
jgi:hypothetical protein